MGAVESGEIDFDLAAREAQVVGSGPRIAAIAPGDMSDEARDLCITVREGVGIYEHSGIPEYMRTMIKHPGIFKCHMEMGATLFGGEIPVRERELAVLRVGWLCRAPYEWGQHVNIAKRYGVSEEEIERVTRGSSAPGWSEHEAAILHGVEELIGDSAITEATWALLAKSWNEAQLIEFPMMVGQYVATAFVQNSLRIALEGAEAGLRTR